MASYECTFCGEVFHQVWRCRDCGMLICDSCSKGGKSSFTGKLVRGYLAVSTVGASEAARAGYRKMKQHCPSCDGSDLIRI